MGIGATNKRLGNHIEVYYAKLFREFGFNLCKTSRLASKLHDSAKIDLLSIPFNIQIKGGIQKGLNAGKELQAMQNCMNLMFEKEDEVFTKPLILIHHEMILDEVDTVIDIREIPANQKVFMSLTQFNKFKKKNTDFIYDTIREWNFETTSEFKTIVHMTFEVFRDEIILKHYV